MGKMSVFQMRGVTGKMVFSRISSKFSTIDNQQVMIKFSSSTPEIPYPILISTKKIPKKSHLRVTPVYLTLSTSNSSSTFGNNLEN